MHVRAILAAARMAKYIHGEGIPCELCEPDT